MPKQGELRAPRPFLRASRPLGVNSAEFLGRSADQEVPGLGEPLEFVLAREAAWVCFACSGLPAVGCLPVSLEQGLSAWPGLPILPHGILQSQIPVLHMVSGCNSISAEGTEATHRAGSDVNQPGRLLQTSQEPSPPGLLAEGLGGGASWESLP